MLPSLSQLPIGARGPLALEDDFARMYLRRRTDPVRPKPNESLNGRVLNQRGDPVHIMDEAERWRQEQLRRMRRRAAAATDPRQYRTMHRTDPIPPVQWEEGMEVLADGSLVNVFASTHGIPENTVAVKDVRSAVSDATGRSSMELARVVNDISDTDGGTLGWYAFGNRLRSAVPALGTAGVMWIVGALYSYYLLKEETEQPYLGQWESWNPVTGVSVKNVH